MSIRYAGSPGTLEKKFLLVAHFIDGVQSTCVHICLLSNGIPDIIFPVIFCEILLIFYKKLHTILQMSALTCVILEFDRYVSVVFNGLPGVLCLF